MADETTETAPVAGGDGFGVNAWLVDELYEQYREDPSSLSPSWQEFFEDYRRGEPASAGNGQGNGRASAVEDAPVEAPPREEPKAKTSPPPAPAEAPARAAAPPPVQEAEQAPAPTAEKLRGVAARIAENMEASLGVPTATSFRQVPAKLLEVNRTIANNYLQRTYGGKVSFTHLIAYAVVKALDAVPNMRSTYSEVDGKPGIVRHDHVNLGLAVDVQREDGSRTLMVPNIKDADTLEFDAFLNAYEDLIRKVRTNKLAPSDFAGTTMTITNPGTIGTLQSVPRLMPEQSVIVGVGAIGYPAEYQAADPKMIANLGLSKVITLTSTYDHRVIQGAESGLFLQRIADLLVGADEFYEDVFDALGVPYEPAQWRQDVSPADSELALLEKQVQVDALARTYRVRGHLIADLDPLTQKGSRQHPELDPTTYGLSIWDLDREFITGIKGRKVMTLGKLLGLLRDAYCRTIGIEYMHIQDPEQKAWIQEQVEGVELDLSADDQRHVLERLNAAEAFERFLHTKYLGHKRFSLEGGESSIALLDALLEAAAAEHVEEAVVGLAHRGRLNVLANIMGKSY